MILVSTTDCKNYWQKRGMLYAYVQIMAHPDFTQEAEELAASWCPDEKRRSELNEAKRVKTMQACARGEHVRGYGSPPECLFCKLPMPYTDDEKRQFEAWNNWIFGGKGNRWWDGNASTVPVGDGV